MEKQQIIDAALAKLEANKAALAAQWQSPTGTGTRHLVIDDFLPVGLAETAYNSFPRNGEGLFDNHTFREKKKGSGKLNEFAPLLGAVTYALQDEAIVAAIAKITDIPTLEPDPLLYAGGISMMFKGDFLNPHLDNSHDANRNRYRRLNLLYYVSPDWDKEAGGNFELWDDARKTPKTLVSLRNRLLVMETNKTSWHSVSPVVRDAPRCCVSNYYFSPDSPDGTEYKHVTSFTGRPNEPLKRALGVVDNAVREVASRILGRGRNTDRVNK